MSNWVSNTLTEGKTAAHKELQKKTKKASAKTSAKLNPHCLKPVGKYVYALMNATPTPTMRTACSAVEFMLSVGNSTRNF